MLGTDDIFSKMLNASIQTWALTTSTQHHPEEPQRLENQLDSSYLIKRADRYPVGTLFWSGDDAIKIIFNLALDSPLVRTLQYTTRQIALSFAVEPLNHMNTIGKVRFRLRGAQWTVQTHSETITLADIAFSAITCSVNIILFPDFGGPNTMRYLIRKFLLYFANSGHELPFFQVQDAVTYGNDPDAKKRDVPHKRDALADTQLACSRLIQNWPLRLATGKLDLLDPTTYKCP